MSNADRRKRASPAAAQPLDTKRTEASRANVRRPTRRLRATAVRDTDTTLSDLDGSIVSAPGDSTATTLLARPPARTAMQDAALAPGPAHGSGSAPGPGCAPGSGSAPGPGCAPGSGPGPGPGKDAVSKAPEPGESAPKHRDIDSDSDVERYAPPREALEPLLTHVASVMRCYLRAARSKNPAKIDAVAQLAITELFAEEADWCTRSQLMRGGNVDDV
jgi:hypothetical protein